MLVCYFDMKWWLCAASCSLATYQAESRYGRRRRSDYIGDFLNFNIYIAYILVLF